MRTAEIRRENRPQNLEDLMKLDLDHAPIREIKAVMIKMGISPHDCFERSDLKKKLIDNVPELKFEMEKKQSSMPSPRGSTSSMSSLSSYGYDETNTISKSPANSSCSLSIYIPVSSLLTDMGNSFDADELDDLRTEKKRLEIEVKSLKQQVNKMEQQLGTRENQLGMKKGQLVAKEGEIASLKSDLQKMTVRANQAERQFLELQGKQKVLYTFATTSKAFIYDFAGWSGWR